MFPSFLHAAPRACFPSWPGSPRPLDLGTDPVVEWQSIWGQTPFRVDTGTDPVPVTAVCVNLFGSLQHGDRPRGGPTPWRTPRHGSLPPRHGDSTGLIPSRVNSADAGDRPLWGALVPARDSLPQCVEIETGKRHDVGYLVYTGKELFTDDVAQPEPRAARLSEINVIRYSAFAWIRCCNATEVQRQKTSSCDWNRRDPCSVLFSDGIRGSDCLRDCRHMFLDHGSNRTSVRYSTNPSDHYCVVSWPAPWDDLFPCSRSRPL